MTLHKNAMSNNGMITFDKDNITFVKGGNIVFLCNYNFSSLPGKLDSQSSMRIMLNESEIKMIHEKSKILNIKFPEK